MKILLLLITLSLFSVNLFALPKAIQADRYLIAAKKHIENKDYAKAIKNFEKIVNLDVLIPDAFYFHYAKTLLQVGKPKKSINLIEMYLDKVGKNGEFYMQALDVYNEAEEYPKIKAKEEAKRKAKEQEQIILDFQRRYQKAFAELKRIVNKSSHYAENVRLQGCWWVGSYPSDYRKCYDFLTTGYTRQEIKINDTNPCSLHYNRSSNISDDYDAELSLNILDKEHKNHYINHYKRIGAERCEAGCENHNFGFDAVSIGKLLFKTVSDASNAQKNISIMNETCKYVK